VNDMSACIPRCFFFLLAALLILSGAARAAEPQPGDACAAADSFIHVGGPENPGTGYLMVCDGSVWKSVEEWDTASGKSLFQVDNDTGTCTAVKLGRIRYNGTSTWEYCNGTAWTALGGGGSGGAFDVAMFMPSTPNAAAIVQVNFPRAVQFPASLTGSVCKAKTAATASTTVTLKKISGGSTTNIGTAVWAAAATSCTFTFSSSVSFAAGDIVEFSFPAPADATLANVTITLAGTKL
jgi:hypothetical protein